MASFLTRALHLPSSPDDHFTDDAGNVHEDNINRLAAAEITVGCDPINTLFCPDESVTRAQMASFLVRALDLPAVTEDYFADDAGNIHEDDINSLAAAEITYGCDPGRGYFCPEENVTRSQMASFLARALGLTPITPPPPG